MAEPSEIQRRLAEKFALSLGSDVARLLAEEDVSDVLINANGKIFVERAGHGICDTMLTMGAAQRTALVRTAVEVSGGNSSGEDRPILELRIPVTGWRFTGVMPPVVDSPVIAIRTPARKIYALSSYVESGQLSPLAFASLMDAIEGRRNILLVGATGAGKTTFLNACLDQIARVCPHDRPVLIEDTPELQCACDGAVPMQTWHEVSMATLLRTSLRLAPTRIVVGEVRGAEASVLLNAWNTGHSGGVCSIHADSALLGLRRVEQMCREGGDQPWREYIASSVHVVCFISKRLVFGEDGVHRSWRRVEEVLWVRGLDKQGEYVCESVTG